MKTQSPPTEVGFEDTILFHPNTSSDLLLVPLEPASHHGDQDMQES